MSNDEMLKAISNMLAPIRDELHGLNSQMVEVKGEITDVKSDIAIMKQDIAEIKEDIVILTKRVEALEIDVAGLKKDVASLKIKTFDLESGNHALEQLIKKIDLRDENVIIPRLNEIEKCYLSTYERYKVSTMEYDAMKNDISVLKMVVAEHSDKIYKVSK